MIGCRENKEMALPQLPPSGLVLYLSTETMDEQFVINATFRADNVDVYYYEIQNLNNHVVSYDTIIYSGEIVKSIIANSKHSYEVKVTAHNSAGDVDVVQYILNPEEPNQWQILWAQNGNTLNFTLSYAVTQIDYPITQTEICTIQGAPLLCQQSSEKRVDVGSLTRGIYILKVTLDTGETVMTQFLKR